MARTVAVIGAAMAAASLLTTTVVPAADVTVDPSPDNTGLDALPGQTWRHLKRDKLYRVVFRTTFTSDEPAFEGAKLRTPDGKYTATLQASAPITRGTQLVVYVPADNPKGRAWVRPLSEFIDGRFEFVADNMEQVP
jgi:hypothetical protein